MEVCEEHNETLVQCRCPGPKTVRKVPCKGTCKSKDVGDIKLPLSVEERLDRIETLLKANGFHEAHCPVLFRALAQRNTSVYLTPQTCECWLKEN